MVNTTSHRLTKTLGLIVLTGLSAFLNAQTMNWAPAGPVYNAGRARNMIVDKNNSQVLYVGSASSGIFKSTDGGSNWEPINDQATIRNISYLAQAADGTLYAGTGEGFLRPGQKTKAQVGTGLYKLSGTDLLSVASSTMVGTVINRVACSPNSANIIALATNKGILTSNDYGNTFTTANLPGIPTSTATAGQDVKFDSNGILYCSIGTEAGSANATTASKVYKSTDAGLTSFTAITPTSNVLNDSYYGRIELAIAPSNNNVIYASCANKYVDDETATLKGLFVSYDAGNSWGLILEGSAQLDPLSNGGTRASGDYAHVITVNPASQDQLLFGGYFAYVYTRTGGSNTYPVGAWIPLGHPLFVNTQLYLHENIHDIKIIPGNPNKFYFITDAGIYRSIDMTSTNQVAPPTFQPFYKGLVTGQFNSVSIERFPLGAYPEGQDETIPGSQYTPYSGFIGGTGGNGLTYFSGTNSLVTKESSYLGGEVYGAEYSKILSNAAFMSTGGSDQAALYRSTNIKISNPTRINMNSYTGALSKIAPTPAAFSNPGYTTTGTYFKLWENYGQIQNPPDSLLFYNDTLPRLQASMAGTLELTTKNTFTFQASRPNKFALIDSIVVRTSTVTLPISGTYSNLPTAFNAPGDRLNIYIKLPNNYTVGTSTTVINTTNTAGPISGPAGFTLNALTLIDNISVTFTSAPFATKTTPQYPPTATGTNIIVQDPAQYYRVFATVYYKYKAGDTITVTDNNISTRTSVYTATLPVANNWRYGSSLPVYTITATSNSAVTSPTYVLTPGDIPSSTPSFTVKPSSPAGIFSYTINTYGTYTLNAKPVTHTLIAVTPTAITSPTYVLNPGNVSQSTATFVVTPTATTNYTITAIDSGTTAPQDTYSVIAASAYSLSVSGGTVTMGPQPNPEFIVSPTENTTYILRGTSSNTLTGANTTTNIVTTVPKATFTVGEASVPMAPNNKPVKIAARVSARLAMILSNQANTANQNAIVVSKNPLALNDPLNIVRVSQSGCLSDDANGNPSTTPITITGKPTMLEWSKSGTELYFATDANRLYRVSHITDIYDLSPSSYSGKFNTDIFKYSGNASSTATNPTSPYRTTLIGTFERPITSISISKDNKNVMVTLNNPTVTSTGTTGIVMYSTSPDVRTSINPVTGWARKDVGLENKNLVTYCSMMEKDDSKKVFIGTDNGIFYTSDIIAGNWNNVNNNQLPNVQIFDIKQQTFDQWDCYNSGQIYVATNGRGIWTNNSFLKLFTVGTEEYTAKPVVGNNLSLYPNPASGNVNVAFTGVDGESAKVQVMDISGRVVQTEDMGKLSSGDVTYSFETKNLNSGVYIVNISSNSGVKRVAKLIVTK